MKSSTLINLLISDFQFSKKSNKRMPRSNKKKKALKPQPKDPISHQMETMETGNTIANLMSEERNKMITRAMCSANYHQINLKPGSPTPGLGDCAFEAIISNINDMGTVTRDVWIGPPHLTTPHSM